MDRNSKDLNIACSGTLLILR